MNFIGKELRKWRKKAGYSQEALAEKLAMSRSCISKFETDKKVIDIYKFRDWAKVCNAEMQAAIVMFGTDFISTMGTVSTSIMPAYVPMIDAAILFLG